MQLLTSFLQVQNAITAVHVQAPSALWKYQVQYNRLGIGGAIACSLLVKLLTGGSMHLSHYSTDVNGFNYLEFLTMYSP